MMFPWLFYSSLFSRLRDPVCLSMEPPAGHRVAQNGRRFVLTYFNDGDWVPGAMGVHHLRSLAGQLEATADGKLHYQLYGESSKSVRCAGFKTALQIPTGAGVSSTCAVAYGDRLTCVQYCCSEYYCRTHHCGDTTLQDGSLVPNLHFCDCADKVSKNRQEDPFVMGVWPDPAGGSTNGGGASEAYQSMMSDIMAGHTLMQIQANHPATYLRYHGGVDKLVASRDAPKTWKPFVCWLSGESGTGKSRAAKTLIKGAFVKASGNKWFDGYSAQEVAILDDFRSSWFPFEFLLTLLDHGECKVEVKGGMRQWKPRVVIITCNKRWEDLYTFHREAGGVEQREDLYQLTRRIDLAVQYPVEDWRKLRWQLRAALVESRQAQDVSSDDWDGETIPVEHAVRKRPASHLA